ncbi:MAG: 2,3-bisphosphoglycerate-independent phosphoglycerate mutase [Clostridia bacterium]|nr:2,3-bisphosphoglycerate-independent phosphoglycerate mutase [Clostridia bacterium]
MKTLTALIILDGFGCTAETEGNAIAIQGAPNIRRLYESYPHTHIGASGRDVGLPAGQMGNSEVGHTNIGAGRVVFQDFTRISDAVADGSLAQNPVVVEATENCKAHDSALHLYGLFSNGGVHSHIDHLFALIDIAKASGLQKVYVHCFTDGRDVAVDSGIGFVRALEEKMRITGCGKIATVMGRYYAMDRNSNFDRTEKAYAALVYGEGLKFTSAEEAVLSSYEKGVTDEFIVPSVITEDGEKPVGTIGENDSIIFYNFRPDRARQITRAFIDRDFPQFERRYGYFPVYYACMTQYSADFADRVHLLFPPVKLNGTMGEYLSACGKTQLRIAETEKYAHVTFFFNGGVERVFDGEDRILIPSPDVPTYDLKPEMSAYEVTEKAIECVDSGKYDFMVLNFANPDMVGHTGVLEAAVKAVAAVDKCVNHIVNAILNNGGSCLITADHGNCEKMIDENGEPFTPHTTNPVPLIYVSPDPEEQKKTLAKGGKLCDLSPTLLHIMGLPVPNEMSGRCLIED